MKPERVCFIQAFLFKRCAYITHNAIQLDLLHIVRCFMQVSDISFPLDATRDFFFFLFWANDNIIILLFENGFPAFIRQSGAHPSGQQSNETSDEGLWCGDSKCKRKGLLGARRDKKQFQLLNLGSSLLETPCSLSRQKHACSWRTGCEEQLPRFSASLVIFQCRWVSRKVRQTEGLRVKDVNRKPTNTEHSHEAAL